MNFKNPNIKELNAPLCLKPKKNGTYFPRVFFCVLFIFLRISVSFSQANNIDSTLKSYFSNIDLEIAISNTTLVENGIIDIESSNFEKLSELLNTKIENKLNRFFLSDIYEKAFERSKKKCFLNTDSLLLQKIIFFIECDKRILDPQYDIYKLKSNFYKKQNDKSKYFKYVSEEMDRYLNMDSTFFMKKSISEYQYMKLRSGSLFDLDSINVCNSLFSVEINNCSFQLLKNASDFIELSNNKINLERAIIWLNKSYFLKKDEATYYEISLAFCKLNDLNKSSEFLEKARRTSSDSTFDEYRKKLVKFSCF